MYVCSFTHWLLSAVSCPPAAVCNNRARVHENERGQLVYTCILPVQSFFANLLLVSCSCIVYEKDTQLYYKLLRSVALSVVHTLKHTPQ